MANKTTTSAKTPSSNQQRDQRRNADDRASPHGATTTTASPHTPPRGPVRLSPSHALNLTNPVAHLSHGAPPLRASPGVQTWALVGPQEVVGNNDIARDLAGATTLRTTPFVAGSDGGLPSPVPPSIAGTTYSANSTGPPGVDSAHNPISANSEQVSNASIRLSANHASTVSGSLSRTSPSLQGYTAARLYRPWDEDTDLPSRPQINLPSKIPSSTARTLPALQARLDSHMLASYAGPRFDPRPRTSSVPTASRHVSAFLPAQTPSRGAAPEPTSAGPPSYRNQGAHPPHAEEEFFYFWMRKHDVVQALPSARRLMVESALWRLHSTGKKVLDLYEMSGAEWEQLRVPRGVGQKLRAVVLEFTREKGLVLGQFMEKRERVGWFMPFDGTGSMRG